MPRSSFLTGLHCSFIVVFFYLLFWITELFFSRYIEQRKDDVLRLTDGFDSLSLGKRRVSKHGVHGKEQVRKSFHLLFLGYRAAHVRTRLPRHTRSRLQFLLHFDLEFAEQILHVAFNDSIELVQRKIYSMIGEPVLWEVVGAYPFASISRTHLLFSFLVHL